MISACVAGMSAHATSITQFDTEYLGQVVDGIPSNPANEVIYINTLNDLAAGAAPIAIGTETYDRVGSTVTGPFPDAVASLAGKDETGSATITGVLGYQYILAKYDAGGAGSLVWYFEDGFGANEVTVPSTLNGLGVSHVSYYNYDPNDVPDGGSTAALLGLGMIGFGLFARRKG